MNIEALQEQLCNTFCRTVKVKQRKNGAIISLPMTDRDGDGFSVYLNAITGGWRLSDAGNTLMRLSYENDVNTMLKGTRGRLFELIVTEAGATEDDGELFLEISADSLVPSLFTFSQMMNRISDLSLWSKNRASSTFQDDLRDTLESIVGVQKIQEDYILKGLPNAENYPIDFCINAKRPLFVFGVQNKDKARLVTIILQHIQKYTDSFDSLVICENADNIAKRDYTRLSDAANDVASNITDMEIISRKINHRLTA